MVATSKTVGPKYIEYGTSIAVSIPQGWAGFIMPRSSISNYDMILSNSIGLIDSGFFGEIKVRMKKTENGIWNKEYEVGERICQLVLLQVGLFELQEVDDLGESDRMDKGFGSSGV